MVTKDTIERCRKADPKAYRDLYNNCINYVFSIVKRYHQNQEDQQDIIQEIFAKVFSKLKQYNEEKGAFKYWIRRITVNECMNSFRKKSKLKVVNFDSPIEQGTDEHLALESITRDDILKLFKDMPEKYKFVFMAYIIDGYNHEEISKEMGISINTSRSQLFNAKKWIRNNISMDIQLKSYGIV